MDVGRVGRTTRGSRPRFPGILEIVSASWRRGVGFKEKRLRSRTAGGLQGEGAGLQRTEGMVFKEQGVRSRDTEGGLQGAGGCVPENRGWVLLVETVGWGVRFQRTEGRSSRSRGLGSREQRVVFKEKGVGSREQRVVFKEKGLGVSREQGVGLLKEKRLGSRDQGIVVDDERIGLENEDVAPGFCFAFPRPRASTCLRVPLPSAQEGEGSPRPGLGSRRWKFARFP